MDGSSGRLDGVGFVLYMGVLLGTFGVLFHGCHAYYVPHAGIAYPGWMYLDGKRSRILWHDALFHL